MAWLRRATLLLLCISLCKSEGLFEDGFQYQYSYAGHSLTGTGNPIRAGSSFSLRADLMIQKQPGYAIVKLTGVSMAMHNGDKFEPVTADFVRRTEWSTSIETPFKLTYTNGKISAFDSDASDSLWSVNIKKAIATALQLDQDLHISDGVFMTTVEETIGGSCKTEYSINSAGKGTYSLTKQRLSSECSGKPRYGFSNFQSRDCAANRVEQDEMVESSQTNYQLTRSLINGSLKANKISCLAHQTLGRQPHYNIANQTMTLKSHDKIANVLQAPSQMNRYKSLVYEWKTSPIGRAEQLELATEEDYFAMAEYRSQDKLRAKVLDTLILLNRTLHTSANNQDILQDPILFGTLDVIASLSLASLKQAYLVVKNHEVTRNLFIKLLPLAGSNPAFMFIKELINDGKMNDYQIAHAFSTMAYNWRLPNEKLLAEYETLFKSNPVSKNKWLKGVLGMSFSHMVAKVCSQTCRPDVPSRYSRKAVETLQEAKTQPEQAAAILALNNLNTHSAMQHLAELATSGGSTAAALRPMIVRAVQPLSWMDRNAFLGTVLPIIGNRTEATEVRIAAATALLDSAPTLSELRHLRDVAAEPEANPEVVNFIHTSLQSLAAGGDPCVASSDLDSLLRLSDPAEASNFRSSNRIVRNQEQGPSGGVQLMRVYGGESMAPVLWTLRFHHEPSAGRYSVPLEIIIRIQGMEDAYAKLMRATDITDLKMDKLRELLHKIMLIAPRQRSPLQIELTIRRDSFNMFHHHWNQDMVAGTAKDLADILNRGWKMVRDTILIGRLQVNWRPNDLGLPMINSHMSSLISVAQAALTVSGKIPVNRAFLASTDIIVQDFTSLHAHNPLGPLQGILQARGSRLYVPVNTTLAWTSGAGSVQLKVDHGMGKLAVFQMRTFTMATVWGPDEAGKTLRRSCPQCKTHHVITKHRSQHKDYSVTSKLELAAVRMELVTLDCANLALPGAENVHSPSGYLVAIGVRMHSYLSNYPYLEMCSMNGSLTRESALDSIQVRLTPSRTPSVTRIAGSLQLSGRSVWNLNVALEKEASGSKVGLKISRPGSILCLDYVSRWSQMPSDMMQTPNSIPPSMAAEVSLVWASNSYGGEECAKCSTKGAACITIALTANVTEEQEQAAVLRSQWPYNQCDLDRKTAGRFGTFFPPTKACYESVLRYATPRRYWLQVRSDQLPFAASKLLARLNAAFKSTLLKYWQTSYNPSAGSTTSNVEEIVIQFNDGDVDISSRGPLFENSWLGVDVGPVWRLLPNARYSFNHVTGLRTSLTGICNVSPTTITTFDNVTASYRLPGCWTLTSADCSADPHYAVFIKKSGRDFPISAKIYAGGLSVEFEPASASVQVKVDDKIVAIEAGKPFVLADKSNSAVKYMTVSRSGARFVVDVPVFRLSVIYTGDDVTSVVTADSRSQHCGLCGDMNGQKVVEWTGPGGRECPTSNGTDHIVNAYILKDKNCKDKFEASPCDPDPKKSFWQRIG